MEKKLISLAIILFVLISFSRCISGPSNNSKNALSKLEKNDSIVLINQTKQEINFYYKDKFDDLSQIILDPLSTKQLITKGSIILIQSNLFQNRYELWPGDSLYIKMNSLNNAILYTNNDPIRNNELDFYREMNEKIKPNFWDLRQLYQKLIKKGYKTLDSLYLDQYHQRLIFLEKYKKSNLITFPFEKRCRQQFETELIGSQINLAYEVKMNVDSSYCNYIESSWKEYKKDNLILSNQDDYVDFLHLKFLYKLRYGSEPVFDSLFVFALNSKAKAGLDKVLFRLVKEQLQVNRQFNNKDIGRFLNLEVDSEYKMYVRELITSDNPDPDSGYDIGIDVQNRTFIYDSLIKNLKGNVLYIDFWASWCVPCRKEMPASKKLKKYYENKDIKFIYLSVDESFRAWLKASQQNGLSSEVHNYFLKGFQLSGLKSRFKITTIPKYILIDQQGRLVSSDAPRPSDPEIKKIINKLLIE